MAPLEDLSAFAAIARAGGFRGASRATGASASQLSEALRRLESRLGMRLLNRTTRTVAPTEAGARLLERLGPALAEVEAALDAVNLFRERAAGPLRLNVPASASRLVLPHIVPSFLQAFPDIELEVVVEERFVDLVAEGYDAGIRYEERLALDMVAVPIGPRRQRMATAASPAYVARAGLPVHPRNLLAHACLRGRFAGRAMPDWEFERDGEQVRIQPRGPLTVALGAGADLAVDAAVAGLGIVYLFEDWLQPYLDRGELVPVLEPWWPAFSGPFLYYPGRRLMPAPLRAFVDFVTGLQVGNR
ncbi:LysR family transcriptional regulator [Pseudacidovorax intermedius]|mgnify:CR=1 FL=1|uniref:LysR family transcriptional regulator n=1 Tax=Pseudacidovorax intermedius TaxID=433924 RepID=UPI0026F090B0|nr:LysR family transcriptional regulator [Pseudacidovorax intermedius]